MLNLIWPIIIIVSYMYAIVTGNVENINNAIFEYTEKAVNLMISLFGIMSLWNGLIEIAMSTRLVRIIAKHLQPVIRWLFPGIKKDEKICKEISMNIIANMMGLGNASTPLGIKAMKSMQEKNSKPDELTNDMLMFILLNTASIQIIPTTVIAIRMSLSSTNPTSIIVAVWISTVSAATVGITVGKICIKLTQNNGLGRK